MSSAAEIALMNTLNRANRDAFAAGNTLLIINRCKIIYYVNCICRTSFFAFAAGDAAVFA